MIDLSHLFVLIVDASGLGYSAAAYHGDMESEKRADIQVLRNLTCGIHGIATQNRWSLEQIQIICATIAFGEELVRSPGLCDSIWFFRNGN